MIVQLEDVWKRYGRFDALRGWSFSALEGCIFALFGANGSAQTSRAGRAT